MMWIDLVVWVVVSRLVVVRRKKCLQAHMVRLAFTYLRHIWHRRDICLSIKGWICAKALGSILPYGTETWPLRTKVWVWCSNTVIFVVLVAYGGFFVSNSEVINKVLGRRFHFLKFSGFNWVKVARSCFACRATVSLCGVLRDRKWSNDGSRWPVVDSEKKGHTEGQLAAYLLGASVSEGFFLLMCPQTKHKEKQTRRKTCSEFTGVDLSGRLSSTYTRYQ